MEIMLGALVGILMAASVWLMLGRDLVKFLFGLILIGNVANLTIFLTGGLTLGAPPLIDGDGKGATAAGTAPADAAAAGGASAAGPGADASLAYANALPQALVLTAIVIGFGLVSFTLVLALRAWQALGTTDVDEMVLAERRAEEDGS